MPGEKNCAVCQSPLVQPPRQGRRRIYCSVPCRRKAEAQRHREQGQEAVDAINRWFAEME